MAFVRIKPSGWGIEGLSSADLTQLDIELADAVDGTAAASTYAAPLVLTGAIVAGPVFTQGLNPYRLGSRSVSRIYTGAKLNFPSSGALNRLPGIIAGAAVTPIKTYIPLLIPHGATVTAVMVMLLPEAATSVPPTKPRLRLQRTPYASGNVDPDILDVTDTVTVHALYQSEHEVGTTGLSHVVDRENYTYQLQLEGAAGLGASLGDIQVLGVKVTYDATVMDYGY